MLTRPGTAWGQAYLPSIESGKSLRIPLMHADDVFPERLENGEDVILRALILAILFIAPTMSLIAAWNSCSLTLAPLCAPSMPLPV